MALLFRTTTKIMWPKDPAIVAEIFRRQAAGEDRLPMDQRGEFEHVDRGTILPAGFPEICIPGLIETGKVEVICVAADALGRPQGEA